MANVAGQAIARAMCAALAVAAAWTAQGQEAPGPNDWETPAVWARGREAPAAIGPPESAARDGSPSSWSISLNGPWNFHFSPTLADIPWGFADPGADRGAWDAIDVPGCWQMQGYGSPRFAAPGVIFERNGEAAVAAENSAASYARAFSIPEEWAGREIFLAFESVQSAFYLWVNGEQAGYSEGGGLPAEFRVTPYLQPGENVVAVQVFRWCDGDAPGTAATWNLAGISGGVSLYAVPALHIRDAAVRTDVPPPYARATLDALVDIRSLKPGADTCTVRAELFGPDGAAVFASPFVQEVAAAPGRLTRVAFRAPIAAPALWSAETPNLYTLELTLTGGDGQTDIRRVRFGFRSVEARGGRLTINGKPLTIHGAVYRPWHPSLGEAVPAADLRRDVAMMKQFNLNAIVSDGRALPPALLAVCDEYGMYVVEAAPIPPAGAAFWRGPALDRIQRMVGRDRNHPSVVAWSLEGADGDASIREEAAAWIGAADPTRPVAAPSGGAIVTVRHPTVDDLVRLAGPGIDGRPVLMSAFAPSAGNGAGGLGDYWDTVRAHPALHGGFVESWSDRTLREAGYFTTRDGARPDRLVAMLGQAAEGTDGAALTRGPAYAAPSSDLDLYHPAVTLAAAVKARTTDEAVTLVGKGGQYGLAIDGAGNAVFSAAGRSVSAPLGPDAAGAWRRIAGVYDGAALRLYMDGAIAAEAAAEGPLIHGPAPVAVGETAAGAEAYRGAIDEVRIFDRALAAGEIAALEGDALFALDFEAREWVDETWYRDGGAAASMDGLVSADRLPRPALWECKKVFEPVAVTVESAEAGKVHIENRGTVLALDAYTARWRLTADGQSIEEGVLADLKTAPGASQSLWIPYSTPRPMAGVTYAVDLSFELAGERPWAPARHEAAWGAFELPIAVPGAAAPPAPRPPDLRQSDHTIDVSGPDFRFTFSKSQGILTAWEADGRALVAVGPEINLWRAPTVNDIAAGDAERWRNAGFDAAIWELQAIEARSEGADAVVVSALRAALPAGALTAALRYRIDGAGVLRIDVSLTPEGRSAEPPRIGLQLFLPSAYQRLQWEGRGPHETYPDRKRSGRVGRYGEDASASLSPYAVPQEFGNKTDVAHAAMVDGEGYGIAAASPGPLHTSAYPFEPRQLEEARFSFLLEASALMTWNIDVEAAGLGNGAAGIPAAAAYRIPAGPRTFTIILRPIGPEDRR